MKKVAFYTLGCKLNFSETSTISRIFEDEGYEKVGFSDTPDIFVINTCSVTDNADRKCRKIVREAQHIAPHAFIVIIGCYAQLKPQEIAQINGVDAVLGASEKFKLIKLLNGFEKQADTMVYACDVKNANEFNSAFSINDRTRTFLKVQDGCDYSCTFCTIPLARGKSRSDSIDHIVDQAAEIGASGVKEIVLTGINTGDYGLINGRRMYNFIDLITALDQVSTVNRFRISSIEPNLLSSEIIEFVATSNRFVPHFHMPLQSGSDNILRSMKRRYLTSLYHSRVSQIRALIPYASIGVDVIVGFPGETDEDFLKTYHFLKDLPVSYLHVFTYSERPNTPAQSMEGRVDQKERNKRSQILRTLSEKKKHAFYQTNIERSANVLFEHANENGMIHGFTDNYLRVKTAYDSSLVNTLVPVTLQNIDSEGVMDVELEAVN